MTVAVGHLTAVVADFDPIAGYTPVSDVVRLTRSICT